MRIHRFTGRAVIAAAVLALTLVTFVGLSSEVSAQTATATRTATAAGTAAGGAAPAAAKTGNAGLVENEGAGIMLPAALAVGTVVLLASGWYVVGRRRA